MEWLSHSHKKHCELCKTPFRFTKLYSPNMPQDLPTGVFFRHSIIHSMRNIATWLRFCLVITVWLGCLPYAIRQIWAMLFWISDGGWPYSYTTIDLTGNSTQLLKMAEQLNLSAGLGNGTSPATPFHHPITPATDGSIWSFLVRISESLNISEVDRLATSLFKLLYSGPGFSVKVVPHEHTPNMTVADFTLGAPPIPQAPSLLSGVPFLSNMTRYPSLNQLAVTISEGYIITILVVVSFILVFLIREWVVQQQFGANLRAAPFNPDVAAPERLREGDPAALAELEPANLPEPRNVGQRPIARPRRRNIHFDDADAGQGRAEQGDVRHGQETGEGARQQRPTPIRDAMGPASEMQRRLAEEPRMTEDFLAIWRRADSDPKEVLRIIEEENKTDEMGYWVNAMKTLQPRMPLDNPHPSPRKTPSPPAIITGADSPTLDPMESTSISPDGSRTEGVGAPTNSDRSSASSDSWEDISKSSGSPTWDGIATESDLPAPPQHNYDLSSSKGKEKEVDTPTPSTQFQGFNSGVSRPRSISDGPQPKDGISMLANNNWTFKNIPDIVAENDRPPSPEPFENPRPVETAQFFASSSPSSDSSSTRAGQGSDTWKALQDIRVQEVVERARENRRSLDLDLASIVAPPPLDAEYYGPIEVRGLDGIVRTARNFEEVFDTHSVGSNHESEGQGDAHEINPLQRDFLLPEAPEQVAAAPPAEPLGILGNIAEWLWGGVEDVRQDEGANDEHIVEDLDAEPPFVPVPNNQDLFQPGPFPGQDREVADAARAAGIDPNDPDAIDEAEDFEGIMELIGMRGPIFSLAQNALFSAFLLTLTVGIGVWTPYNIGRASLLLVTNPGPAVKLPLRLVFWSAALLQDLAATAFGVVSYTAISMLLVPVWLWSAVGTGSFSVDKGYLTWGNAALQLSNDAVERILRGSVHSLLDFTDEDIYTFSAASHESLLTLGSLIKDTLSLVGRAVSYLFVGGYSLTLSDAMNFVTSSLEGAWQLISGLPLLFTRPDTWVISLEVSKRATPLNPELSAWSGVDRFWAIVAGYSTLYILGALYVKKGTPFSTGQVGREWEATIMDLLLQAGGVMKVILIISIEMLVFPLYCGMLLDGALLPLFDNVTIMSRIQFTLQSPFTSVFVHWFVGTCYMFHFALFVSMCRKIMRKGVLCEYAPPKL